ncbi:hypothetical protein FGG08_004733 [Glutinoglossum americanum]|uniref:Uncharacterized protein n=1 Tax=Glutinoglossum americanum TaxID=1670608 RepID=A0A9P8HZR0_9PEZI|nr:hypothetical protein FGG08_004733 [Glutinoglossum americanum]
MTSAPQWFHCSQTKLVFHCEPGMLPGLNPGDNMDQFTKDAIITTAIIGNSLTPASTLAPETAIKQAIPGSVNNTIPAFSTDYTATAILVIPPVTNSIVAVDTSGGGTTAANPSMTPSDHTIASAAANADMALLLGFLLLVISA